MDDRNTAKFLLTRVVEPEVAWTVELQVLEEIYGRLQPSAVVKVELDIRDHAAAAEIAEKGLCQQQSERLRFVAEQIARADGRRPGWVDDPETKDLVVSILHA